MAEIQFEPIDTCHFTGKKCRFLFDTQDLENDLIPETRINEYTEIPLVDEEKTVISNRPFEFTRTCTNCLLGQMVEQKTKKKTLWDTVFGGG